MKQDSVGITEGLACNGQNGQDGSEDPHYSLSATIRKRAAELIQDPQVLGWFNNPIITVNMKPHGIPIDLWNQMSIEQRAIVSFNQQLESMREYRPV